MSRCGKTVKTVIFSSRSASARGLTAASAASAAAAASRENTTRPSSTRVPRPVAQSKVKVINVRAKEQSLKQVCDANRASLGMFGGVGGGGEQ